MFDVVFLIALLLGDFRGAPPRNPIRPRPPAGGCATAICLPVRVL